MNPRSVFLSVLVLAFWGGVSSRAAELSAPGGTVPFTLHRGHLIVVKCAVGGLEGLRAIVDTGATETVLDISVIRRLSLAVQPDRATFMTQQSKVWGVAIPSLQLGSLRAERLEGIATDLSSLTAQFRIRPQVLIGMDVLHRTNFVIDYKAHRLLLGAAPAMAHRALLVPGNFGSRFAIVESTIAGRTLRLQLDTGFAGLLLYRKSIPAMAVLEGHDAQVVNVARTLLARNFEPPDVQIGDWHAPHAQLTVVDDAPPEWAEFDGLIGTAFLSRQCVAFDFENRTLYWE